MYNRINKSNILLKGKLTMKILNFTSLKNHDVFEFSYACNYDIVTFFLNIDSWLDLSLIHI